MHLGADVMSETSDLAGISLGAFDAEAQLRANLPHAGYGQGQVVTSPLRMARIAAAIGSDGAIRETPMVMESAPPMVTPFLSPGSARVLGGYMRDAVTQGSGRRLRQHPVRIAGKTGTAEVDAAASHAWFVGFAPHGAAERRIAFAVILENAGYGGSSAAAAAGEIVTAAASMGLTR
jgi:peptidoglycan glycosyltransferase